MSNVLITGISGMVGSHLSEYIDYKDDNDKIDIYGTIRWRSKLDNIVNIKDQLNLIYADMRDSHSILQAVKESEPDYIFHLAAMSYVPMSWTAPADTMETNVVGTVHLLEAVRQLEFDPVIHIAGSSEEYGLVLSDELPIKETNQLRPNSPYGVSKVAEDLLGQQYNKSYGLKTVITRAFNHSGPRRAEVFVTSNFAKQIADYERDNNPNPKIYVGNLDSYRDFTDVRDIVKAYWLSVNSKKIKYGEPYNICSGKTIQIREVLNLLLSFTDKHIEIKHDPSRMRPSDVETLHGDCSKFKKVTGWESEIPFEQTMKDLLEYWRNINNVR